MDPLLFDPTRLEKVVEGCLLRGFEVSGLSASAVESALPESVLEAGLDAGGESNRSDNDTELCGDETCIQRGVVADGAADDDGAFCDLDLETMVSFWDFAPFLGGESSRAARPRRCEPVSGEPKNCVGILAGRSNAPEPLECFPMPGAHELCAASEPAERVRRLAESR